jgi:intracellular sulfur oxidation DsrE/DsrF family protein
MFHTFSFKISGMKKIFLSVVPGLFFTSLILAQQKQHKIIFDFTKADTASFATMVRHAKNIMDMTGNAKLEIVCHGPGLDMLVKDKTSIQKGIEELHEKFNVVFAACEVTMRRRGIEKSQLVAQAITVPAAILEISSKQQDGWSYIKEE